MDADPKPAQSPRRPDAVRRAGGVLAANWELAALCCWAALWFVILARHGGIAWDYFVQGSSLVFTGHDGAPAHPGGLHIYANYPELQIGPLAFGTAQLFRLLGPDQGLVLAELIMAAMGLVALYVIRRVTLTVRPELAGRTATRWTFLSGGAVFVITWQQLAVYFGHLDDALALLAALLALWAAVSRRPVLTGLLLGLSVDAKPWALIFMPILLLAGGTDLRGSGGALRKPGSADRPSSGGALRKPGSADRPSSGGTGSAGSGAAGRPRLRPVAIATGAAAAVIAAAWLPFYVADPGTLTAARYTIVNLPDSALRALGVDTPKTPSWDRAAQVAAGCALGAAAIWRRRWPAVILLGAGARIALDPAAHAYYTAGVMLGALTWDMLGSRRPVPLWSIASFGALTVVPLVTKDAQVQGMLRLALVIAFTVVILAGPARWCWSPPGRGSSRPRGRPADAVQGRRS